MTKWINNWTKPLFWILLFAMQAYFWRGLSWMWLFQMQSPSNTLQTSSIFRSYWTTRIWYRCSMFWAQTSTSRTTWCILTFCGSSTKTSSSAIEARLTCKYSSSSFHWKTLSFQLNTCPSKYWAFSFLSWVSSYLFWRLRKWWIWTRCSTTCGSATDKVRFWKRKSNQNSTKTWSKSLKIN